MKTDPLIQQLVDSYGSWVKTAADNRAGGTARPTKALYPYETLFSPIRVNGLTLKNRLMMAPMGNIDMCEETGRPDDRMLQYFFDRAKGGVGLISTGLVPVSHGIDPSMTEPGGLSYFPRIDRSRTVFSGWRDLAQGVHALGSRIFIQLTPGLGRVGNPQCLIRDLKLPVSSSWNPNFYIPQIPCRPLSGRKLRRIVKNTGQAAADAKACGLDGVYLHGHEGYLLEQMTNRAFNRRRLGRYADWQLFGLELIQEIRRRTGEGTPIMYRIDLSLALNETYGPEGMTVPALRKFKNGRTAEETLAYMENLVKAGVDMFDVDLGCYDNWWLPHPPAGMPAGCFLEVASLVKEHFKKKNIRSNAGLEIPVVAVGKLGYPDIAEEALRRGQCDMIMLGRPLLSDPDWPTKAYAGRVEDIRPCIGCQEGCINEFVDGGHIQCAVNPRTGFEHLIPEAAPPAAAKKRIAVVGAGPAGIVFSVTAAARGHMVELYEKSGKIGGKLLAGGVPKNKYELFNYRKYLERVTAAAVEEGSLKLHLNTEPGVGILKALEFDAIVIAAGTQATALKLPGIDRVKTIQAADLLGTPSLLGNSKKIVVVGGGSVGCETAYWLAYEKGCNVAVVEMLPHFMDGACTANRGHLIHYMKRAGVRLFNCARVTGFGDNSVEIVRNVSAGVPDPYNTWQPVLPKNVENPLEKKLGPQETGETLEADLVVLALGGKPNDALFYEAQRQGAADELYNIGDSFSAGRVLEAVRAAYILALKV